MKPYDCVKCGAKHGMVLWNRIDDTEEPLDMCYDCIFSGIKYNPIPAHLTVDDIIKNCRQKLLESEAQLIADAEGFVDITNAKQSQIETWLKETYDQIR